MPDLWDGFRYISYVRLRWRFVAASCLIAMALATAISLVMPAEYTATARIVIEPPAGADPRSAMAVSPVYLESLKTYEEFAAGDSLFQKAAERFQLRTLLGPKPIESLEKSVLKVGLVRNTRILEIAATLPNPARAQALAQFLAEQTVALNRSLTAQSGNALLSDIEQQERAARARLDQSDKEWTEVLASKPVADLQSEIDQAGTLRASLQQQATSTNVELADVADRLRQASAAEAENLRREESNARARIEEIRKQIEALDRRTAANEKLLAERNADRDRLDGKRRADEAALTALDTRLRDARNDVDYRGERLSVIDPGVVPERPSSPNLPLNLAAALLLGLLLPVVYLALELSFQQQRAESRRAGIQPLAKLSDE